MTAISVFIAWILAHGAGIAQVITGLVGVISAINAMMRHPGDMSWLGYLTDLASFLTRRNSPGGFPARVGVSLKFPFTSSLAPAETRSAP